jgi:hypothetical protein
MTPAEYATEIVLPTVHEYLDARGDRRRAYLACIAVYHITDYVARAEKMKVGDVSAAMKGLCKLAFETVQGVRHGSKHCGNIESKSKDKFPFTPGDESYVPLFAWDEPGATWDQDEARWDVPGLALQHAGQKMLIDECLHEVLVGFGQRFPQHFQGVDLAF